MGPNNYQCQLIPALWANTITLAANINIYLAAPLRRLMRLCAIMMLSAPISRLYISPLGAHRVLIGCPSVVSLEPVDSEFLINLSLKLLSSVRAPDHWSAAGVRRQDGRASRTSYQLIQSKLRASE